MSDIVKVTIDFEALETKIFRMYSGAFVRGFVYWVLRRLDRTFAEKLHSSKNLSPFSVTPVMHKEIPVDRLEEGKKYSFSITFFVPEIGEALKNYLVSADSIYFTAVNNPLRKVTVKYCDEDSFFSDSPEKFSVDFISPCFFRIPSNDYRFIPLPLPNLMFRSLARLYSAFISEIPSDYRDWLDENGITVSGLKIETEKVMLRKGKWAVGFKGIVNFGFPDDTYREDYAKITAKLLNFGEYSNVGGGRTSGLGVMRIRRL